MNLTAFDCRLGLTQGRLPRPEGAPGAGASTFVLGDSKPGRRYDLAPGDHAEVTQQVDLTGADLLRAYLHLRVPQEDAAVPVWEVSIVVDGTKAARTTCRGGQQRAVTDLAANISKLSGLHTVGVRLELVSA